MTYIKYASSICFILAMFFELIGFVWLHKLHVASCNPKTLNHKLLKQIFLRYTNCAKLNINIVNTSAFVERYIANHTFWGIHYTDFEKIGSACAISGIFIATYGTFQYNDLFIKYGLMAILVAMVYAFFCSLLNIHEKKRHIVFLITDYLDNTLQHRLESRFGTAANKPTLKAAEPTPSVEKLIPSATTDNLPKASETPVAEDQFTEEIIFSVINDFLI